MPEAPKVPQLTPEARAAKEWTAELMRRLFGNQAAADEAMRRRVKRLERRFLGGFWGK